MGVVDFMKVAYSNESDHNISFLNKPDPAKRRLEMLGLAFSHAVDRDFLFNICIYTRLREVHKCRNNNIEGLETLIKTNEHIAHFLDR